jgi:succinoglycan biosynthesis protein ExoA
LNESKNIRSILETLAIEAEELNATILVIDGGSTDGTQAITSQIMATNGRIELLDNPKRIQSAALNLAARHVETTADYLIRVDAHGEYPADYCRVLVEEASSTGADSVVVAMVTKGHGLFQKATATAQNSRLGTGGSKHRVGAIGHWVDHGHHALMRVRSFLAVGGYDEEFSHNEDAELDYRLTLAGYRIWMTDRTGMVYFPRSQPSRLFSQYRGYGSGRARNIFKHHIIPKPRQMIPLVVAPAVILALLLPLHWVFSVPFFVWLVVCLGSGAFAYLQSRDASALLSGVSSMIMHFAWSVGFWSHTFTHAVRRTRG